LTGSTFHVEAIMAEILGGLVVAALDHYLTWDPKGSYTDPLGRNWGGLSGGVTVVAQTARPTLTIC
jgi:hypothetical protein